MSDVHVCMYYYALYVHLVVKERSLQVTYLCHRYTGRHRQITWALQIPVKMVDTLCTLSVQLVWLAKKMCTHKFVREMWIKSGHYHVQFSEHRCLNIYRSIFYNILYQIIIHLCLFVLKTGNHKYEISFFFPLAIDSFTDV